MKVEELKCSLRELVASLDPKSINETEFFLQELEGKVNKKAYRKLGDRILKENGYYKSIEYAALVGVTRQEVSQMLNRRKFDGKFHIIEFEGCKYIKGINYEAP